MWDGAGARGPLVVAYLVSSASCVEQHPNWAEPFDDDSSSTQMGSSEESAGEGTETSGGSTTGGAASCVELWQSGQVTFANVEPLSALNTPGFDGDPSLSPDELTLYYSAEPNADGAFEVRTAKRESLGAPWGDPVPLAGVNDTDSTWTFAVTASDELALFITDRPGGPGQADIWQVTRANADAEWGAPSPRADLSSAEHEWDIWISPDGLLAFWEGPGIVGPRDVLRAERSSVNEDFDPPQSSVVSSTFEDTSPSLTADLLVMVFSSDRPGSAGEKDIWFATRSELGMPFGDAQPVEGLNTPIHESELHISDDGCELYFSRAEVTGTDYELYRAEVVAP